MIVLYVIAQVAYFYVLDPTTIASVSTNSSVAKTVVTMLLWRERRVHGDRSGSGVLYGRADVLVAWARCIRR